MVGGATLNLSSEGTLGDFGLWGLMLLQAIRSIPEQTYKLHLVWF